MLLSAACPPPEDPPSWVLSVPPPLPPPDSVPWSLVLLSAACPPPEDPPSWVPFAVSPLFPLPIEESFPPPVGPSSLLISSSTALLPFCESLLSFPPGSLSVASVPSPVAEPSPAASSFPVLTPVLVSLVLPSVTVALPVLLLAAYVWLLST